MAVTFQSNIQSPPQGDWGAFQTINSSDLAEAIESAQQRYARQGARSYQIFGPFKTTSTTLTDLSTNPEVMLAEMASTSTLLRPDDAANFNIQLSVWARWAEVQLEVFRLTTTGSSTILGTVTASSNTGTLTLINMGLAVSDANRRFGGSLVNDPAPLRYVIKFRMVGSGATEAYLECPHIIETELASTSIP